MCGITGFISNDIEVPVELRSALLHRMCDSIYYRGPDEEGTLVRGRAALGMRRLSIIDIKTGQQPIFNTDGNLAIVFNGEIYNFRDVRSELEGLGHHFRTNSDTEVIVHAYEEFGEQCLSKLRGMFAFAIWDFRNEELFLARDRVGKKPLFYATAANGDFVFGSELKTLLTHGGIERAVDEDALDAYLSFGYVPDEFCMVRGVEKLLPGHFLKLKDGRVTTEEYWDLDLRPSEFVRSDYEWADLLISELREAVKIRLVSEVPLGAFLSGGIDSSAIIGLMSEFSDKPVKTFSIGFREDSYDELKYARIAADHFGTEHHEFIVTPDLYDILEDIVWHFDEPFADQSSLPTFMLSRLAREHVTVVLSGDGGDELFAGYERYSVDSRRSGFSRIPGIIRRGLLRRLGLALPHSAPGKNFLYNVSLDPISRYIDSISAFNGPRKVKLYTSAFFSALNGSASRGEAVFEELAGRPEASYGLSRLLYLDSKTYLPGDILTKVDRMTMANSIEARVPFLDQNLIELVARMPAGMKLRNGVSKYILKKALGGIVPDSILYRAKQGFGVPISKWINDQLRDRIIGDLSARRTIERGYFKQDYIETLLKEHEKGRRNHSDPLWLLWMLELWMRRYIDGRI